MIIDLFASLGGLAGVGAMISSLAALRSTKSVKEDCEQLRPNHGSSIADKVDALTVMVETQGAHLQEMSRLITSEMEERQALARRDEVEHAKIWEAVKVG